MKLNELPKWFIENLDIKDAVSILKSYENNYITLLNKLNSPVVMIYRLNSSYYIDTYTNIQESDLKFAIVQYNNHLLVLRDNQADEVYNPVIKIDLGQGIIL